MAADQPETVGPLSRPDGPSAVGRSALEDLRERLARLPPGHPSAAGYRRPAADRLASASERALPNGGACADGSPAGDQPAGSGPGAGGSGHVDRERPRERGGHENPAEAGPPGRPGRASEADLLRRLDRPGAAGHQATAGTPEAGRRGVLGQPSEREPYRPWFADVDAPWFGADLAGPFSEGPVP